MMILKCPHKISLTILLITLFTSQGCVGIFPTATPTTMPIASETVSTLTTKTPIPKPTNTNTPDYVATDDFIETASINTIMSTVQPEVLETHSSPDGKWQVDVIRYDCINYAYPDYTGIIAYEQLKIVNLSNGAEKIVEDQLLNCDGVGAFGFDGLYWSSGNRYFYFSDWREGSPDGGCGNYLSLPIYRLDTLTQEIIMIGGGPISPDQTKLAMWQENEIVIWDLDKGEVGRVRGLSPDALAGGIGWSPDGQSLVYLQTTFDCAPDYGTTYVTRLDLTEMSQTLLLKFQPPGFGGVSWEVPDRITLMDGNGKFWAYDLSTKETLFLGASALTPTPVPTGIFPLMFYPHLILEYDASEWTMVNDLQSRNLKTCAIGEQGPTDFNGTPPVLVPVQLGNISYSIIFWEGAQAGDRSAWYIEGQSLTGYDYSPGLPILVVQASLSEWEDCKILAEKVLATLHAP